MESLTIMATPEKQIMDTKSLKLSIEEGESLNVEIFDDRVEIVNPGGITFPKEDFGKISVRRNEIISDLFFRMDKCERVGSGIQRMKDEMRDAGLQEPKFEVTSFFRVIFYRLKDFTEKSSVETREKIIKLILENPQITITELSAKVGITVKGLEWNITQLKQKGMLQRIGPDKGGHWKILKR